ncbi:MAG TPA: S41 family peptidase [Thermoguttaceae bacterium]|nr:S41 family peptidase [Thermoguttaceae bacterium]
MPRRNIVVILVVAVVSTLCHGSVQNNRFGRILVEAMNKISQRSLKPIDKEALLEGGIEGMVRRLGDPHSAYLAPQRKKELDEDIKGEFDGVGMVVGYNPKTEEITVLSPIVGTPAYEAGIRAGDKILAVDGESTQGMPLEEAVGRIKGERGTQVTLTILHEDEKDPVEIKIVRKTVHVDSVLGDTRIRNGQWNFFLPGKDRIGYVRINKFARDTPDELRRALTELVDDGMRGLILDLRDNPGGLLEEAVAICDMFIESGDIVSTRGRGNVVHMRFPATEDGTFGDFPIAVLVNHYSASASEIVAGCLQEHGRAKVIGQRTYGKGTVQDLIELDGGHGAIRLTTAKYWVGEKNIHKAPDATEEDEWGILPDEGYEVVVEGEDLARLYEQRRKRDLFIPDAGNGNGNGNDQPEPLVDPQLEKAVEYIEGGTP